MALGFFGATAVVLFISGPPTSEARTAKPPPPRHVKDHAKRPRRLGTGLRQAPAVVKDEADLLVDAPGTLVANGDAEADATQVKLAEPVGEGEPRSLRSVSLAPEGSIADQDPELCLVPAGIDPVQAAVSDVPLVPAEDDREVDRAPILTQGGDPVRLAKVLLEKRDRQLVTNLRVIQPRSDAHEIVFRDRPEADPLVDLSRFLHVPS